MTLDEKGRCCGRKPILYKRGYWTPLGIPHKFCARCGKSFDIETGEEIREADARASQAQAKGGERDA